jgi:DNA primase
MDVIALHQAEIANAVAPLGTAFTDDQAKLLRRWAERIFLVFDSDEAGQNAAVKAILTCRKNSLSCAVVIPGLEKNRGPEPENSGILKDPADILKDFGPQTLKKRMQCYINDFEYLVNRGRSLFDISAPEGKSRAVAFLFPYLETLDSDVSRDDCFGAAADAFGVDRASVLNDYNRRRAGEQNSRQEVPQNEKPIRMNDELFLLTLVSVNVHLYPQFRNTVAIKEIEDPAAKELFIALEECFIHEESGIDALLSRISSGVLRNFVAEKGMSKEFSGDPGRLIADGVKGLKKRKLQKRLSGIVSELRNLRHANSAPLDDIRINDLVSEKMYIDAEIRELEGR